LDIFYRKIYLLGLILKFAQIFAKAFLKQTKTQGEPFFQFRPQTQNMNFSRSREIVFEKKCALFFSKVGSEESQGNTEEKVGLRQPNIFIVWSFTT
jgi:hypothetical protein